jgi:membrane-associated phospholipid phosphatase
MPRVLNSERAALSRRTWFRPVPDGICLAVLIVGVMMSWHRRSELSLDHFLAGFLHVPRWIERSRAPLPSALVAAGSPPGALLETGILAIVGRRQRGWRIFVWGAAPLVAGAIAELLKRIVADRFPLVTGSDRFPSTHAAVVAAFAAAVVLYYWIPGIARGRPDSIQLHALGALRLRAALLIPIVGTLLIGWLLVASHKHTATEVIGGMALGLVVARAMFFIPSTIAETA